MYIFPAGIDVFLQEAGRLWWWECFNIAYFHLQSCREINWMLIICLEVTFHSSFNSKLNAHFTKTSTFSILLIANFNWCDMVLNFGRYLCFP
jgi:hypothetical protein